jgi:hypothetical protein
MTKASAGFVETSPAERNYRNNRSGEMLAVFTQGTPRIARRVSRGHIERMSPKGLGCAKTQRGASAIE